MDGDAASSQSEVAETPRDPSPKQSQQSDALDASGPGAALSIPLTVTNSQESHITSSSAPAMTPPASDISSVTDGAAGYVAHDASSAAARDRNDHLLQLSTIAAAQDRISTAGASKKRMADGEVKAGMSPARGHGQGHARNLSTVSATSTGSTIGEVR
jgi:hypothetical protein